MGAERISCFFVPFHVAQTLRMHSEITLLDFLEWSGINPIYAANSTQIVWTLSQWVTKIVSKQRIWEL